MTNPSIRVNYWPYLETEVSDIRSISADRVTYDVYGRVPCYPLVNAIDSTNYGKMFMESNEKCRHGGSAKKLYQEWGSNPRGHMSIGS